MRSRSLQAVTEQAGDGALADVVRVSIVPLSRPRAGVWLVVGRGRCGLTRAGPRGGGDDGGERPDLPAGYDHPGPCRGGEGAVAGGGGRGGSWGGGAGGAPAPPI